MKRTITISGIGHKKGTSRAKKDYDFYVISGFFNDPDYIDGSAACEIPIPEEYISNLSVGQTVDVVCHYYNGKTYVDAVIV